MASLASSSAAAGPPLPSAAAENTTLPDQGFASRRRERFVGPHVDGNLYAVVNHHSLYGSTFINDVVDDALRARGGGRSSGGAAASGVRWVPVREADEVPEGQRPSLQWQNYEDIDWQSAFDGIAGSGGCLVDGYCNRAGLIRKAHLAQLATRFAAKRPDSRLRAHFPPTVAVSVDARRDWLAFSIADVLDAVEAREPEGWLWILKPSRTDRDDHHVVRTPDEAEAVLRAGVDVVEWVCQRYIHNPLLVHGRKFHVRVNVLAVGALQVFVHRPSALVSTAALPFDPSPEAMGNKYVHISNAIYAKQYHGEGFDEAQFKFPLDQLPGALAPDADYGEFASADGTLSTNALLDRIGEVVRDTFEAASQDFNAFVPHGNSFELFGLDFVLDEHGVPFLLECNAGCDWESMFGVRYQHLLERLFADTLAVAVDPTFSSAGPGTAAVAEEDGGAAVETALEAEPAGGRGSHGPTPAAAAARAHGTGFQAVLDKQAFASGTAGMMRWGGGAPDTPAAAAAAAVAAAGGGGAQPAAGSVPVAVRPATKKPALVSVEEAAAQGVVPGTTSLRLWWAGSLYRASVSAVDGDNGTVRYRLLQCVDDDASDSEEEYDSEEDPLDAGFMDRIEPPPSAPAAAEAGQGELAAQ